jgi:hypothetical protein
MVVEDLDRTRVEQVLVILLQILVMNMVDASMQALVIIG